ncbi:sigma-54-dependent Fis family transcriptional regulator [Candidatus Micrarchaeota archaeon]|nr:MAG: sigma-54-dependent Fis family transcriptional regulator [Candidatus Micrarchaeota archaeon]
MKREVNILVVDDEEIVRSSLVDWLREDGYHAEAAENGFEALEKLKEKPWDIALVDLKMPKMDGLELMERMKKLKPDIQVIIITAYATVHTAVQAMKMGAYDYLVKPFNPEEISLLINRLIESQELVKEISYLRKELAKQYQFHDLISKSPKMQKIFEFARTVAKSNSNILILGESGTGKELLARAIHNESLRAAGPFVAVSCVALPETLLESELFGHEKGAFTDAVTQKKGKFELAHGGTLFLDEIGDISPKLQLNLLRVLQEKEFTRVGGTKPIRVDVRIIAATNRDLKKAVEEGKFRDDLYYRLNVISIQIPPLRERKEDIPLLVHHFIEKFNIELGKRVEKISEEALKTLMKYDWPGNIRELENVIERAMVITKGTLIKPEDIQISAEPSKEVRVEGEDKSLRAVERAHIQRVLEENDWNIQRSAQILGIDRVTLYKKIKKYGLKRKEEET